MKVLVTGATGFVGGALVRALLARGDQVRVLLRGPGADAAAWPGAEPHAGDLGDPNSIARAASGCESIFHCAGESASHASAETLAWINVAGTENTLAAARHARVRRLVLLSCADVSLRDGDRLHWSEHAALAQAPLGALARSKLLAEEVALPASDRSLLITALRPAWLWGPGEHTNMPALCAEAERGGVQLFSGGHQLFATTHIDNLIAACLAAAIAPDIGGQAIHIADGEPVTAREFFEPWCAALRLPPPRAGIYPLAYAAAWLRRTVGLAGPWPEDVARRGRACLLDCERAIRLLDYQPRVSLREGMAALASWAERAGGPSAIVRLQRRPGSAAEATHLRHLAGDSR